ncbi:hypothetical protein [Nocardia sp. NPDC024068]|uniref:hypothetical protein n=1 Tax=Nocardia sp. NPDC024068 TaxID=3157197 RepID=UPI003407CBD0
MPPDDTGAVPGGAGREPVDVIAAVANTLARRHPGGLIEPPDPVGAAGVDMRALEQVFEGNFVRAGFERGATPRQERFRLRWLARDENRRLVGIGRGKAEAAREQAQQRDEEMQAEVDELSRVRAGLAAGQDPGANIEARLADTARVQGVVTEGLSDAERWTVYAGLVGEQIVEKRSARERARAGELAAGAREAEKYAEWGAEERARLRRLGDERKRLGDERNRIDKKEWRKRSTSQHLRESLEELGPGGTLVVVEEYADADAFGVNARPYVLYLDSETDTVMVEDGVSGGPVPFDFSERAGVERTFTAGIRGDGSPMVRGPGGRGDVPPWPGKPGGGGDGTAGYVPESVDPGDKGPDFGVSVPGGQPENFGIPPVDLPVAGKRPVGSDSGVVSAGPIPEPETSVPVGDLDEVGIAAMVPELVQQGIAWRTAKDKLKSSLFDRLPTEYRDLFSGEILDGLGRQGVDALQDPGSEFRRYVDEYHERLRVQINRVVAGLPRWVPGLTVGTTPESALESTRTLQVAGDLWLMPDRPAVLTSPLADFARLHGIVAQIRELAQYTRWIEAIDAVDSAMHREFAHPGSGPLSLAELRARAAEFSAKAAAMDTIATTVRTNGVRLRNLASDSGVLLNVGKAPRRDVLPGPETVARLRREVEELELQAKTLPHPDRQPVVVRLGSLTNLIRTIETFDTCSLELEEALFELDTLALAGSSVESRPPQDSPGSWEADRALEWVAESRIAASDLLTWIEYYEPADNVPPETRRRQWLTGIEALDRAVRYASAELEFASRAGGDDAGRTRAIERMYWQWRVEQLAARASVLVDQTVVRTDLFDKVQRLYWRVRSLVEESDFGRDTGFAASYRAELDDAMTRPVSPQRLLSLVDDIREQLVWEHVDRVGRFSDEVVLEAGAAPPDPEDQIARVLIDLDELAGGLDSMIQELGLVERQVDGLLGPDSAWKVLDDLVPDAGDAVAPHRRPDTEDAEWEPNRCGARLLGNIARVFGRDDVGELEGVGELSGVLISRLEQALAGDLDERPDGDAGRAVRILELAELEAGVRRLVAAGQERGGVAVFDPIVTSAAPGELGHTYLLEWSVDEQGELRFRRYDDQLRADAETGAAETGSAGAGHDFALPTAGFGGPVFVMFLDAGGQIQSPPGRRGFWRTRLDHEDFPVGAEGDDLDRAGLAAHAPELAQQRLRWADRREVLVADLRRYLARTEQDDDDVTTPVLEFAQLSADEVLKPDSPDRARAFAYRDQLRRDINDIIYRIPEVVKYVRDLEIPDSPPQSTDLRQALGDLWSWKNCPPELEDAIRRFALLDAVAGCVHDIEQLDGWNRAIDALGIAVHVEYSGHGADMSGYVDVLARVEEFDATVREFVDITNEVTAAEYQFRSAWAEHEVPMRTPEEIVLLAGRSALVRINSELSGLEEKYAALSGASRVDESTVDEGDDRAADDSATIADDIVLRKLLIYSAADLLEASERRATACLAIDLLATDIRDTQPVVADHFARLREVGAQLIRERELAISLSRLPQQSPHKPTAIGPPVQRVQNWLAGYSTLDNAIQHAEALVRFADLPSGPGRAPETQQADEDLRNRNRTRLSEAVERLTVLVTDRRAAIDRLNVLTGELLESGHSLQRLGHPDVTEMRVRALNDTIMPRVETAAVRTWVENIWRGWFHEHRLGLGDADSGDAGLHEIERGTGEIPEGFLQVARKLRKLEELADEYDVVHRNLGIAELDLDKLLQPTSTREIFAALTPGVTDAVLPFTPSDTDDPAVGAGPVSGQTDPGSAEQETARTNSVDPTGFSGPGSLLGPDLCGAHLLTNIAAVFGRRDIGDLGPSGDLDGVFVSRLEAAVGDPPVVATRFADLADAVELLRFFAVAAGDRRVRHVGLAVFDPTLTPTTVGDLGHAYLVELRVTPRGTEHMLRFDGLLGENGRSPGRPFEPPARGSGDPVYAMLLDENGRPVAIPGDIPVRSADFRVGADEAVPENSGNDGGLPEVHRAVRAVLARHHGLDTDLEPTGRDPVSRAWLARQRGGALAALWSWAGENDQVGELVRHYPGIGRRLAEIGCLDAVTARKLLQDSFNELSVAGTKSGNERDHLRRAEGLVGSVTGLLDIIARNHGFTAGARFLAARYRPDAFQVPGWTSRGQVQISWTLGEPESAETVIWYRSRVGMGAEDGEIAGDIEEYLRGDEPDDSVAMIVVLDCAESEDHLALDLRFRVDAGRARADADDTAERIMRAGLVRQMTEFGEPGAGQRPRVLLVGRRAAVDAVEAAGLLPGMGDFFDGDPDIGDPLRAATRRPGGSLEMVAQASVARARAEFEQLGPAPDTDAVRKLVQRCGQRVLVQLADTEPALIAGLSGVPAEIRHIANSVLLQRDSNPGPESRFPEAAAEKSTGLRRLTRAAQGLPGAPEAPEVTVLSLDRTGHGMDGADIVALGDIEKAARIRVVTRHTQADPAAFTAMAGRALREHQKLLAGPGRTESVATLFWVGSDLGVWRAQLAGILDGRVHAKSAGGPGIPTIEHPPFDPREFTREKLSPLPWDPGGHLLRLISVGLEQRMNTAHIIATLGRLYGAAPDATMRLRQDWAELYRRELRQVAERLGITEADLDDPLLQKQWLADLDGETDVPADLQDFRTLRNVHRAFVEFDEWGTRISQVTALGGALRQAWEHSRFGTDIRAEFDLLSGLSQRLDGSVGKWAARAGQLDSAISNPGTVAGEPISPDDFGLTPGVRRWTSAELNALDDQVAKSTKQLAFYLDGRSEAYSDEDLELAIGFGLLAPQTTADSGDPGEIHHFTKVALDYLQTTRLRALADRVDAEDLQLAQLGDFNDASLAALVELAHARQAAPVQVLGPELRRLHLRVSDPEDANAESAEPLATAAEFERARSMEWDIQEHWVAAKQRYLDAWTDLARAYPAEAERVGRLSEPAVLRELRGPDGLDDSRNELLDTLVAAADEFGRYQDLRLRLNARAAELEPWARTRAELGDALSAHWAVVEQLWAEAGVPSTPRRDPAGVSGRLLAEREQQVRAALPDVLPPEVTTERVAALAPRLQGFRAGRDYLTAHRLVEAVAALTEIGDRSAVADRTVHQGLSELLEMADDQGGYELRPAGPTDGMARHTPPPPSPTGRVPAVGDGSAALAPPSAAFPKICAVDAQSFIDLLLDRIDPTLPSVFGTSETSRDIRENGTDPLDIAERYRANWSPGGFSEFGEMRELAAEGAVVLGAIDTDSGAHAFVLHRWADGRVWVHVIENGVRVDVPLAAGDDFPVADWTVPPAQWYGIVLDIEVGADGVMSYTPRHEILRGHRPSGNPGETYPAHRLGGESTGRDRDAGQQAPSPVVAEELAAAGLFLADLRISPGATTDSAAIRRAVTFLDGASTEFRAALFAEFPQVAGQSELVAADDRDRCNRRLLTGQITDLLALSLAADRRAEVDAHLAELLTTRDLVRDLADQLMHKAGFRARLLTFPQPGQPGPLVLELGVAADLAAEQVITYVPGRVADAAAARRAVRAAAALTLEANAGGRPTAVTVVVRRGAADTESVVGQVVHRIATVAAARELRSPELPQPRFEIVHRGDGREIGVEIARRFTEPAVVIRADGEPSAAPARELSPRPRPEEFRPFVRKPESVGRTGSHGGRTFELELNFLRDAALAAGTTPAPAMESENATRTAEFVADLDNIEALTAVAKAQMEYWGGRAGQLADDAGLMRRVIELETLATRIFEAEAEARRGYDSTDRTPEVNGLRDQLTSRARETVEWAAERKYTWQIGDFAPSRVLGPATLRLAREFTRQLAEFATPPDLQPGGWTHRNVDALAERQRQLHRDRDLRAAHLGELIGYPPALLTPEHVEVLAERLSRPAAAGHAEADRLRHVDRELIAGAAFLAGTARAEGLALLHGATVWTRAQLAVLDQEFRKLARGARELREMARDARELGDYDFAQEPTELNRLRELRGRLYSPAPDLEEFDRFHISARLDLLIDLAETRQHLATRETALAELAGQVEDLAAQYFQAREALVTGSDSGDGAVGRTPEIEAALEHALGPVLEAVRTARQPLKLPPAAHPEDTVPSRSPAVAAPQGPVSTGPDRAAGKQARLDGDPDNLPPSAERPRDASDTEQPGVPEERPAAGLDPAELRVSPDTIESAAARKIDHCAWHLLGNIAAVSGRDDLGDLGPVGLGGALVSRVEPVLGPGPDGEPVRAVWIPELAELAPVLRDMVRSGRSRGLVSVFDPTLTPTVGGPMGHTYLLEWQSDGPDGIRFTRYDGPAAAPDQTPAGAESAAGRDFALPAEGTGDRVLVAFLDQNGRVETPRRQPESWRSRTDAEDFVVGADDAVPPSAGDPVPPAPVLGEPGWRVRRVREEVELARVLFHDPEVRQAAVSMLQHLRAVLIEMHAPDRTSEQIERVEDAFYAVGGTLGHGQVARSVSLDELAATGSVRELMCAVQYAMWYSAEIDPPAGPTLDDGVTELLNRADWAETAARLGLDTEALGAMRARIVGADPLGTVELLDVAEFQKWARSDEDLPFLAERELSEADERIPSERWQRRRVWTVQDWQLLGMPLSSREFAAIPGPLTALEVTRLEPGDLELPRTADGRVDEDALEDALRAEFEARGAKFRFALPLYEFDEQTGRRVRDANGNAVVALVRVYCADREVTPEEAQRLDPNKYAVPLPADRATVGSLAVDIARDGEWFRSTAVERGFPVVSAISGTAARFASRFLWLKPPGVSDRAYLGAVLAFLMPEHHSLYELVRAMQNFGLQVVDPAVFEAADPVDALYRSVFDAFGLPMPEGGARIRPISADRHAAAGIAPGDLPPSAESPRGASDAEKPGDPEERPADIGDPWTADGYAPAPLNADEQAQVAEVRRLLGGTGPVLPLRHTHVPGLALVAEAEPDLIAGRAGIPGDLRDRANRVLLHRVPTADPERAGGRAHELRRLDRAAARLPGDSVVRVFSLDLHGDGTDLVVIGDIERADKIVVDVSPGATDPSVFAAASSRALEYYNGMAADPGEGPSPAVVFWAGADIGVLYEQLSAILEARAVDALDDGAGGPGVPSELRFLVDRSRPLPDDFPEPALFQLLTDGLHEQLRLGFRLESYLDANPGLGSLGRAEWDRLYGELLPEIARQLQVSEADIRDPVRMDQLCRDAADNPDGVSPDQLDFFALDNLRTAVAELERWRTRAERVITLSRALATAQAHYAAGFDTRSELEMLGDLAAELDRQAGDWFTARRELHRPPRPGTVAGRPIQPEVFGLDPRARRQTGARLAALEQAIELNREKWSIYIEHAISDEELASRVAARDVRGDLDAGRPRRFRDPAVAYLQAVELHKLSVRAEAADLMFEQRTELMDASLAAVEQIIAARPEAPGLGAALRELRQHFATPGDPQPHTLDDAAFERATEVLETARRHWAEAKQHSQDAWKELRGYPDNPEPGRLPDFADLRAEDALDDLDEEHEARLDTAAAAADVFAVAQLLLDRLDAKAQDLERFAAARNALAGADQQTDRRDEIAALDRDIAAGLAELIRIGEHPGAPGIAAEPAATEGAIPAVGDGSAMPDPRAKDVPKICAVDATAFISLLLGIDTPSIPSISGATAGGQQIREKGTSPFEFAANLGANWRSGGFAGFEEMRARAEAGSVVAGAVDTDTDAHVFVLHPGIAGEVWVHTLVNGIRTDMPLAEEWTPAEGRLYGIVFASDDVDAARAYTPEHPILVGDYPVGVAGYDFPRHGLGGESGASGSDPAAGYAPPTPRPMP